VYSACRHAPLTIAERENKLRTRSGGWLMGEPQPDIADRGARRDLEMAVNEAIEACDGDLRATVRALIVANGFLEDELNRTRANALARLRAGTVKRSPRS
jgi:hypothetical protein